MSKSAVDAWGLQHEYIDAYGRAQTTSKKSIAALRQAIGIRSGKVPRNSVRVVHPGKPIRWHSPGRMKLEDGGELKIRDRLPADLPLGYHVFQDERTGEEWFVIASPEKCVVPSKPIWGWSLQLYSARSRNSWGMGDLADLRAVAKWSRAQGASIVLINPLNAVAPLVPQERSPYSPASRRFRNPLYLRIEEIPGAAEFPKLSQAGRDLNNSALIDRDAVFRLKMQALELLWRRRRNQPAFAEYRRQMGQPLEEFAAYCILSEQHGSDWRKWPSKFRAHTGAAVQRFVAPRRDRFEFHQWLQWLLDEQLAGAGKCAPLMQDLPIGVDPGGADAWVWQDVLATGVAVGAPPDIYNPQGQNWGLPPWNPHRLRAAHYQPFIHTIRAMLRHAGGLRIDHALGLFRLFWIPDGMSPTEGGYVRYPYEELLAIIALESHRAGAFIVGEDLGTTEKLVQRQLAKHAVLSYKLLWFEKTPPAKYPVLSLAAVTTHDLPTIAGVWNGDDLRTQQGAGCAVDAKPMEEIRQRLQKMAGLKDTEAVKDAVEKTYRLLAKGKSLVSIATLEDALMVSDRPNLPSAGVDFPNWRRTLPLPLEEFCAAELPRTIAKVLQAGRKSAKRSPRAKAAQK